MGLRHPCGHGSDTDFRHQLDTDSSFRIYVFKIVDQLRQILDGINVVVWWRRNETDSRGRMSHPRYPLVDLVPWKLATLTRFGTLRHLDLDIIGVHQILRGNTETPGGYLLNP